MPGTGDRHAPDWAIGIAGMRKSLTVASGVVLTVPSGTMIHCRGDMTNGGRIVVAPYAPGGLIKDRGGSGTCCVTRGQGHPGIALFPPMGEVGAVGVTETAARALLRPGPVGGGGSWTNWAGVQP